MSSVFDDLSAEHARVIMQDAFTPPPSSAAAPAPALPATIASPPPAAGPSLSSFLKPSSAAVARSAKEITAKAESARSARRGSVVHDALAVKTTSLKRAARGARKSVDLRVRSPRSGGASIDIGNKGLELRQRVQRVKQSDATNLADVVRDTHVLNGVASRRFQRFVPVGQNVTGLAVSSEGGMLAIATHHRVSTIHDTESGKVVRSLKSQGNTLCIAFSLDSAHIATGAKDGYISVFNASTGAPLCEMHSEHGNIRRVRFHPLEESHLACACDDGTVIVVDWRKGKELRVSMLHDGIVRCLAFSHNGKFVATGSRDRTSKISSIETGEVKMIFEAHSAEVYDVCFSHDGCFLATCSADHTCVIFDVQTGSVVRTLIGHTGYIYSIAFSPDDQYILSGSMDRTAILWHWSAGTLVRRIVCHTESVRTVAFSSDQTRMFTGAWDKCAVIHDVRAPSAVHTFVNHKGMPVTCVAFSPDASLIGSGSDDHTARLADMRTGEIVYVVEQHTASVRAVSFSLNGRLFASGSLDCTVVLTDLASLTCLRTMSFGQRIYSVQFTPDSKGVAAAIADGCVAIKYVWDDSLIMTTHGHSAAVNCIDFTRDGKRIATGSDDYTCLVHAMSTRKLIVTLSTHTAKISSVAFTPDAKALATASSDCTAHIYNTETWSVLHTVTHEGYVTAVGFSPCSRYLATCSRDATAAIHNVKSGERMHIVVSHAKSVTGVAFSSGEGAPVMLATCSWDGSTIIHDLLPLTEMPNAKDAIMMLKHLDEKEVAGILSSYPEFLYDNFSSSDGLCALQRLALRGKGLASIRVAEAELPVPRSLKASKELACVVEEEWDGDKLSTLLEQYCKDDSILYFPVQTDDGYTPVGLAALTNNVRFVESVMRSKLLLDQHELPTDTLRVMLTGVDIIVLLERFPDLAMQYLDQPWLMVQARNEVGAGCELFGFGPGDDDVPEAWDMIWLARMLIRPVLSFCRGSSPLHYMVADQTAPWALWRKNRARLEDKSALRVPTESVFIGIVGLLENSIDILRVATSAEDRFLALFEKETIMAIIDFKWETFGRKRFTMRAILFAFYFTIVNIIAIALALERQSAPEMWASLTVRGFGVLALEVIAFTISIVYLGLEFHEMVVFKCDYVRDVFNWIDVSTSFIVIAVVLAHYFAADITTRAVLESIMAVLIWLRSLNFVRAHSQLGFFVRLLLDSIWDAKLFAIILLLLGVLFAVAVFPLANAVEDTGPFASLVSGSYLAFQYMLGRVSGEDLEDVGAPAFAALLLCTYMLISNVIMLNMVIAIIGDTFNRAVRHQNQVARRERADLIVEIEELDRSCGSCCTHPSTSIGPHTSIETAPWCYALERFCCCGGPVEEDDPSESGDKTEQWLHILRPQASGAAVDWRNSLRTAVMNSHDDFKMRMATVQKHMREEQVRAREREEDMHKAMARLVWKLDTLSVMVRESAKGRSTMTRRLSFRTTVKLAQQELFVASWNIASVNNNPFEYWMTGDSTYMMMMASVERFLTNPDERDVRISTVFTEDMFNELESRMEARGWTGLDKLRTRWSADFSGRRIIANFLQDRELSKKRLISMPDRVSNSPSVPQSTQANRVFTDQGSGVRPSIVSVYDGDLSSIEVWYESWLAYFFDVPITVMTDSVEGVVKTVDVCDLLVPIRQSRYPAITAEEEAISIPLQLLCLGIFDAILVYVMNACCGEKEGISGGWPAVKRNVCDVRCSKRSKRIMDIIEKSYSESGILCLQEVSHAVTLQLRRSALASRFVIVTPLQPSLSGQSSLILLCKERFASGIESRPTSAVRSMLREQGVSLNDGDLCSIVCTDCHARQYLIASFHGSATASIPVLQMLNAVVASSCDASCTLVCGIDANTTRAAAGKSDVAVGDFSAAMMAAGLTTNFGDEVSRDVYTTKNARTSLQPQLHKAVSIMELEEKANKHPKDFVIFSKSGLQPIKTWRDNTGDRAFDADAFFPTMSFPSFPSDHCIVGVVLKPESTLTRKLARPLAEAEAGGGGGGDAEAEALERRSSAEYSYGGRRKTEQIMPVSPPGGGGFTLGDAKAFTVSDAKELTPEFATAKLRIEHLAVMDANVRNAIPDAIKRLVR